MGRLRTFAPGDRRMSAMGGKRTFSTLALPISIIALLFISASTSAGLPGPTIRELADALAQRSAKPVQATDVRRLSCVTFGADEPTEARCRWQQLVGGKWKRFSAYAAVDGQGWQLTDQPAPAR